MMSHAICQTMNLSKKYKDSYVLKNINLTLNKGEIYGLIGGNGAGKTTLLRMITGLSYPTEGTIVLMGETESEEMNKRRNHIGCIIDSPSLYLDMTAEQNLEAHRIQRGIPGKSSITQVLELVHLSDTKKKKVKQFSLGMKQRLALAVALLGEPKLLILDEPTNGLDPVGIVEFRQLIQRINKDYGTTILISSHILSELYQTATKFGVMHQGSLISEISEKELDDACKKHLYIMVSDTNKAVTIIEETLHTQAYRIGQDNSIKLYDYLDNSRLVSSTLMSNGIHIDEISVRGEDLSSYYLKLIGGVTSV